MVSSLLLSPQKSSSSLHGRTRSLRDGLSAISESLSRSTSSRPIETKIKVIKSPPSSVQSVPVRPPRKVKSTSHLKTSTPQQPGEEKQVLSTQQSLPERSEHSFRLYPKIVSFEKPISTPGELPAGVEIARTVKGNENGPFKAKLSETSLSYRPTRRTSSHIAKQKIREGSNAWQSAKHQLRRSVVSTANTKKPLPPPPGFFSDPLVPMPVQNIHTTGPSIGHRRKPSPPLLTAIPELPSEFGTALRAPVLVELPGNCLQSYFPTQIAELECPPSPVPSESRNAPSRPVTPTTTTNAFEEIYLSFAQFSQPLTTEVELPLTPPDTPESPQCITDLNLPDWDAFSSAGIAPKIVKEPDQSWLSLSPPSSCSSSVYSMDLDDPAKTEAENNDIYNEVLDLATGAAVASASPETLLSLPQEVLLKIFMHLPTTSSISTFSRVAKPLHKVYTSYENIILSKPISHHSPALHALAASLVLPYPRAIKHCIMVAHQIRHLIRTRCNFFPDTPNTEVAIYNIWHFSQIFLSSPSTPSTQASWLRSQCFSPLTLREMLEVYQSIGVLLCPLTTEVGAAVKAGAVADLGPDMEAEMEEALELWVMGLQTLPLDLVLPVIAIEEHATTERWDAVVRLGLVESTRGRDGRSFFRTAFGEVMADEMMKNRI
ncbi:hypothetical protein EDC01DRAFT_733028 [Geopyxis carbonaria]|nr:hypothetical protein EDC01DRAFT_733028 [Geopyxis carbonaria]